ncbi:glycosyltransferase family A protein [Paenibacillus sp. A3]|uniref:glycosyltransferase family 2 protein n=1 Tax=Paenibacillus sp. A3 TaxID=1337054 RepID=UPI0006D54E38|nr:glycosyltransferase family A protein [Paenibacillus sp. A3]
MLFIVLDSRQSGPAEQTQASVRAVFPDSRCVLLESHAAGDMNEALADDEGPWFAVLYAGERLLPAFRRELETWVRSLEESDAGVLLFPAAADGRRLPAASVPRGPVLWRTKAWNSGLSPGFADPGLLPFERYALVEKQSQLSAAWHWPERQSLGWLPAVTGIPDTKRAADEWRELAPILKGRYSAAIPGKSPFVTVVLCLFNDAEYLVWAIRSVCAQTYPHWELLIMDDGSTDGAKETLRACPFSADPRIRFVRCERNMGKSHTLNRALSMARGRWLLELDADDWLMPDCLRLLAGRAAQGSGAAFLYGSHRLWHERRDKSLIMGRIGERPKAMTVDSLLKDGFPLAPRMYNVERLKQLGGWLTTDPFEGRLYEDLQLLARLLPFGPPEEVHEVMYHRRLRMSSITHRHPGHYAKWLQWMRKMLPAISPSQD